MESLKFKQKVPGILIKYRKKSSQLEENHKDHFWLKLHFRPVLGFSKFSTKNQNKIEKKFQKTLNFSLISV